MTQPTRVENGRQISVEFTLSDENGNTLGSSEQSGPMVYVQGDGAILPGIEQALAGRQMGESIRLTLPPEQAYGEHRPELVFEVPRDNLPPGVDISPGAEFFSGMGDRPAFSLRVLKETENGALLDGNHPLAGKTLHAQLKVLSIQ